MLLKKRPVKKCTELKKEFLDKYRNKEKFETIDSLENVIHEKNIDLRRTKIIDIMFYIIPIILSSIAIALSINNTGFIAFYFLAVTAIIIILVVVYLSFAVKSFRKSVEIELEIDCIKKCIADFQE